MVILTKIGIGNNPFIRKLYLSWLSFRTRFPLYIDGVYYYLDKRDDMNMYLLRKHFFDKKLDLMLQNLKPGDLFVDIGAHIGQFSMMVSRKTNEEVFVRAFEPDFHNAALFEQGIDRNNFGNIKLSSFAIGDKYSIEKIYRSNKTSKTSLYQDVDNIIYRKVIVHSLDIFNLNPSVVKIDTQGYEPLVLIGMKNTIRRNKNLKIMLEYYPYGMEKIGWTPKKFFDMIFLFGFKITDIETGEKYNRSNVQQLIDRYKLKRYTDLWLERE